MMHSSSSCLGKSLHLLRHLQVDVQRLHDVRLLGNDPLRLANSCTRNAYVRERLHFTFGTLFFDHSRLFVPQLLPAKHICIFGPQVCLSISSFQCPLR
jgi:hypothetical protein